MRTYVRWKKDGGLIDQRQHVERVPANKLSEEERAMALETANNKTYKNLPPSKIVPLWADDGKYLCSESTHYRILRDEDQLKDRRGSRPPVHHKPKEFEACAANQVWTWDISYLPSNVRGLYFYLYLIVDIYSRKIVGWSIHDVELSEYAASLMKQACLDEKVSQDQLVLHSDNGSPMKGASMLSMLQTLGVMPSFSRPSVSDDNPYSEALFKTMKYHPTFPRWSKFKSIIEARIWSEKFVDWYNNAHLHSALKFVTPHQRHTGEDQLIREKRAAIYELAKEKNPERWSKNTRNWKIDEIVTLNPDKKKKTKDKTKKERAKIMVS